MIKNATFFLAFFYAAFSSNMTWAHSFSASQCDLINELWSGDIDQSIHPNQIIAEFRELFPQYEQAWEKTIECNSDEIFLPSALDGVTHKNIALVLDSYLSIGEGRFIYRSGDPIFRKEKITDVANTVLEMLTTTKLTDEDDQLSTGSASQAPFHFFSIKDLLVGLHKGFSSPGTPRVNAPVIGYSPIEIIDSQDYAHAWNKVSKYRDQIFDFILQSYQARSSEAKLLEFLYHLQNRTIESTFFSVNTDLSPAYAKWLFPLLTKITIKFNEQNKKKGAAYVLASSDYSNPDSSKLKFHREIVLLSSFLTDVQNQPLHTRFNRGGMLVHEHRHAEEDDRGHAPCESGLYASSENKEDPLLGCDSFFCDFQVNAEACNLSEEIKSKENVFFDGMSKPMQAFSYHDFKSKHLIKEFLPDYKLREFYAEEAKQNNQNTKVIEEIKKRATGNFISGYNYQANYYYNVIHRSHYDNSIKAFSKEMLNYLLGNHFNNVSSELIIKTID